MSSASLKHASTSEKAAVEVSEKSSVDGARSADDQPALGYTAPARALKPKLPIAWRAVIIVLTCLCTCMFVSTPSC